MLPTRLQVLKLHLFFKDEAGRGNGHVKPGEITGKIEKVEKVIGNWLDSIQPPLQSAWTKISKLLLQGPAEEEKHDEQEICGGQKEI